jgi:hypothetical protein
LTEENEEAKCESDLEASRERRHITGSEFDETIAKITARLDFLENRAAQITFDVEALKGPPVSSGKGGRSGLG